MPRQPQVNVRVSQETLDVLEATTFVRRLRSPQELVGPVIDALARRLRESPEVEAALRARVARDAEIAPARGRKRDKKSS